MNFNQSNLVVETWRGAEPGAVVLKELEVRVALPEEMEHVGQLPEAGHDLGQGREVGRGLVRIVHHRGRWVAILCWGAAAMKLIDRDQWVGWTAQQRSERLGLVVQNRRFLVLSETRMPNLASRALGLSLRALGDQWEAKYGYRPVLAETFTDIESFEGTCYKAEGWEPCGLTKSFGREHRADFYRENNREHKRPKKLWLKPLVWNAREILCAAELWAEYQRGLNPASPERALPLSKGQIESLRQALRSVPDLRRSNRCWPLSVLLCLVCMGLLAGRKNLAEIHRYGLTQTQRAWLGLLPKGRGLKSRRAPSYQALYNLLNKLDADTLAGCLNGWLQSHWGSLPRGLALDGE